MNLGHRARGLVAQRIGLVCALLCLCLSCGERVEPDQVAVLQSSLCSGVGLSWSDGSSSSVRLTATPPSCGSDAPEYRFAYAPPETTRFTEIRGWSTNPTMVWDTAGLASGLYYARVYARAQGSTSTAESNRRILVRVGAVCDQVALTVEPALDSSSALVLEADAACRAGVPEYEFVAVPAGGSPVEIRAWGPGSSFQWDTTGFAPGSYQLIAYARNRGNSQAESSAVVTYAFGEICSKVIGQLSPAGPASPGEISVLASSTCSDGAVPEFRYSYRPLGGKGFTLIQDWSLSTRATLDTTGLSANDYQLNVEVRQNGAIGPALGHRYLPFVVGGACASVSLTGAPAPGGVRLTATASCSNGTPEYAFFYRAPGSDTFVALDDYAGRSIVFDQTAAVGVYDFMVSARAVGSPRPYQSQATFSYQLGGGCSVSALTATPPVAGVDGVLLTANASCADGAVPEYRFSYGNNLIADWSTANTTTMPRLPAGNYAVQVEVRGQGHAGAVEAVRSTWLCGPGYQFDSALGCVDVDECKTNNGDCDVITRCTNTVGGRTCGSCPAEFEGDGETGCVPRLPETAFDQIAVGASFNCGIRSDGTAHCWGEDRWGMATPPPGHYRAIAVRNYQACGALDDGTVTCWGDNHPPTVVTTGDFVALAMNCGLLADGHVRCFDIPGWFVAGFNPTDLFSSIASFDGPTCGLRSDGVIRCWDTQGYLPVPSEQALALSVAETHACAVLNDRSIKCWNFSGEQLASAPPAGQFQAVASTKFYDCALDMQGKLGCWGRLPTRGIAHGTFASLSAGGNMCAQTSDHLTRCWSADPWDPQAGTFERIAGTCFQRADHSIGCWNNLKTLVPSGKVKAFASGFSLLCWINPDDTLGCAADFYPPRVHVPFGKFAAVDVQIDNVCAIQNDGQLGCWSYRGTSYSVPSGAFKKVSGACAIRQNGEVSCWSMGGFRMDSQPPPGPFDDLSCTVTSCCALRSDRTIACWGSPPGRSVRVEPAPFGADRFAGVAAALDTVCGLRVDGTVACIGSSNAPADTRPPNGQFKALATDMLSYCALDLVGHETCWGYMRR